MNKNYMRKLLKTSKTKLLKNETINPTYFIKPRSKKKPIIIFSPSWDSPESKIIAFAELRRVCKQVDAKQVTMVSDCYLHGYDFPFSDGLFVTVEEAKRFQVVLLPYTRNPEGEIVFDEEVWENRKTKRPDALCEGLVQ
jgi:hypothetical protein